MTTPNSTPQPSRRTVLKAASAAGIVWATPILHSSTVHALNSCLSVQFDSTQTAQLTSNPADDGLPLCPTIPACPLSGTGSLCTCSAFETSIPVPASAGTVNPSGTLYTAPAGCTVVAANARVSDPGGSSCAERWPCVTGTIVIDPITNTPKTATFPPIPFSSPAVYWKHRIILCCTT